MAVIASDDFSDAQTDSWGNADVGGAWTIESPASQYDKAAGVGTIAIATGETNTALLASVSAADPDITVRCQAVATGLDYEQGIMARGATQSTGYVGGLWFETDNTVTAILNKRVGAVETSITFVLGQGTYALNDWWWVRFQLQLSLIHI